MKPATSIVLFTTIAGAAQGLVVVLAAATLADAEPQGGMAEMLWVATAMLIAALGASFFHLGHPVRAWRAALMWRTSWMSREVIVLPAFIALTAMWAVLASEGGSSVWVAVFAIAGSFTLWYCTAMIYACIRFVQEWAHPLTIVNYTLLGLSSGAVLAASLAVIADDRQFTSVVTPWAIAITVVAWVVRGASLRRNAALKLRSSPQSATGIHARRVVQKSMGMTGGSFNTREFFHDATPAFFRAAKPGFQVFAFAVPITLLTIGMASGWTGAWLLVTPLQMLGLMLERWFFFAQARHPQNIYYQMVS